MTNTYEPPKNVKDAYLVEQGTNGYLTKDNGYQIASMTEIDKVIEEFREIGRIVVDIQETELGTMTTTTGGATEEQINWLRTLLEEREREVLGVLEKYEKMPFAPTTFARIKASIKSNPTK